MNPLEAIPAHPGAVVVGGGIAGLVSAWELARAGVRPLLIEARGYLGGLIARGTVGDVDVDLGAETYVVRGTDTSSIVEALGLTSPVRPCPARRLGAAPLPARLVPRYPGPPGRTRLRPRARRGRGAPGAEGSVDGRRRRHGRGRGYPGRFRDRAHGAGRAGALGASHRRGHLHR